MMEVVVVNTGLLPSNKKCIYSIHHESSKVKRCPKTTSLLISYQTNQKKNNAKMPYHFKSFFKYFESIVLSYQGKSF